ncbi:uncharacterized protein LOC127812946 [Diospyros lotus]|uniref:uncharacterized protein LOC127812946 n=1 Tax=Diospyros lotus TaxID=55363 RepID=UPI002254310A|nr:uncharacterized protein LOC127812946 [Diospyros lotus]
MGKGAAACSNSVGYSMASAAAMPIHRPNSKHQQEMISGIGNTTTTTNTAISSSEMKQCGSCSFQMPLHYPRYKKVDYESMPEWKLDCLLSQYGLPVSGDVTHKRNFAMGAFLWPS